MTTRILLIEDDPDITRAVHAVLDGAGFSVGTADDGRAGLRAFHDRCTGLVALDTGLPGLDGWQVLERIRDMSDVPILMLTAHGLEADKVRGLRSGAADYLTKPFGNQELLPGSRCCAGRVDPSDHWGGLSRTSTPEGEVLWLCRDHVQRYSSEGLRGLGMNSWHFWKLSDCVESVLGYGHCRRR